MPLLPIRHPLPRNCFAFSTRTPGAPSVCNDNYRPRRREPLIHKGTAAFSWYILSNAEVETDKSMPELKMQALVFKCVIVLD